MRQVDGLLIARRAVNNWQHDFVFRLHAETPRAAARDSDRADLCMLFDDGRAVDFRKAIIKQENRVVPHPVAIEHDGHELDAVALRRRDEAASRRIRVACLDAVAAFIEPEHLVLIAQTVRVILDPRECDFLRAHDFLELRQRVAIRGNQRKVVRCRVVRIIRQAVRIDEVRVFRADFMRLVRHEAGECIDGTRDVLSDGHRRVVARMEHHAIEQLAQRDFIALFEPERRAFRASRVRADLHDIVEVALFERDDQRHDFRRARREPAVSHVALIEHAPRLRLHDDGTARRHARQRIVRRQHEPVDFRRLLRCLLDDVIRERGRDLACPQCQHDRAADGRRQCPSLFP